MRTHRIQALAAAAALLAGSAFAQVKDYRDIKTTPLRAFDIQQPKRVQLDNGMVIFLQEDHELPLVRATARVRGGARDVDAGKAGLSGIYGQTWRTGGTDTKTGDQLDDLLEARGAKIETFGGEDSTSISFDALKTDVDLVFPIFVDLLRKPAFRQDKLDLAKTQANTNISRRNDNPSSILGRESSRLVYGADSPYARTPEYATIASITRDDLVKFHDRFVYPNNIIIGVTGDFDAKAMEARLRQAFASWAKGPAAPPAPTQINSAKPGVYFAAKDDVTQSNITLTHLGTTRNSPDYYALQVMNEILDGGSFSGRLMNHIRTQKGLVYGVGGGVGTGWDHPATFRITMATKSGSTVEAINAARQEIADIQAQPPSAEEVAMAKELIANSFVFTMDSKAKVMNERMSLEFYGYPADWYQRYLTGIQKVTPADVQRVAQKYITPARLTTVVVGREKDFDKPLSTLGDVTKLDITIPEPMASSSSSGPKATATSSDAAALMRKVVDFVGGAQKLQSVNATRTVATLNTKGPQGEMEIELDALTRYPADQRVIMKTGMGDITMVSAGDNAFMVVPGAGTRDLPSQQRDSMARESKSDLVTVLRNVANPKYIFSVAGNEKVGDVNATIVDIDADGAHVKWWIDPATGKVLRKQGSGAQGVVTTDYTAWQSFGGLMLPSAFASTNAAGERVASATVKSVEINPAVDATAFNRP